MEYLYELINRYKSKGILIDTNLLLLYYVGLHDPDWIHNFKRTMAFTVDEFYLLARLFESFDKVIATPNVMTEVSNLSGQLPRNLHENFYTDFAARIPVLEERHTPSKTISASAHFSRFGLTDAGIIDTVKGKHLVLTDDLRLFGYLQNLGIDAINFNHVRTLVW